MLLPLRVDVLRRGLRRGAIEARDDAPHQQRRIGEAGVGAGEAALLSAGAGAGLGQQEEQGLGREVEEEEVGGVQPQILAAAAPGLGGVRSGLAVPRDGGQNLVGADELCCDDWGGVEGRGWVDQTEGTCRSHEKVAPHSQLSTYARSVRNMRVAATKCNASRSRVGWACLLCVVCACMR